MTKLFYQKSKGSAFMSNLPAKIVGGNDKVSSVDVTDEESEKIFDGKHSFTLGADKKLSFVEAPLSPTKQAKKDLKAKLEAGTATEGDRNEALKLLL